MNTNNRSPGRPEKSFKYGAVRAAIWKSEHQARNGQRFETRRVVLDRSYKDGQGAWKNTNSLDLHDIPKAILALERAYEYLLTASASGNDGADGMIEEEVI